MVIILIGFGGIILIHNLLEEATGEKIGYIESVKMFITLKYDGKHEKQLKAQRKEDVYEHVSIYYLDHYQELIPLTKDYLDWAIQLNEKILGDIKKRPVNLIFFKDRDEMYEFSLLEGVNGFYSDFDKVMAIKI